MKTFAITAIALALSTQAFAADNIYEGRGNIYRTNATLADLQSEATRLNSYNYGNTIALQIHDGQIKDLEANKADKSEVAAVNTRVDHTNKQVAANTKETVRLENVKADKSALKATDQKVAQNTSQISQQGTQISNNTTVINQHSNTLNEYGSKLDSYGASHDALASNVAQYQSRTDSRLDTLESDVRQAKEAAAVALAVAGHQFCTDLDCGVQAAVSGSTIAGKQAVAVGVGGAVSENLFFNAAFSQSGSTRGGVVSATYRLK